jgi:hypothetical protein
MVPSSRELFLGLVAYDLGCCHFYNEEYGRARDCFTKYFKYAARLQPATIADINIERLVYYRYRYFSYAVRLHPATIADINIERLVYYRYFSYAVRLHPATIADINTERLVPVYYRYFLYAVRLQPVTIPVANMRSCSYCERSASDVCRYRKIGTSFSCNRYLFC